MTLYSADIMDLAKPIEKKPRKTKKEKVLPTPEPSEPDVAPTEVTEKPKKEMTEKQKAALLKAQETRKRKKEEALLAKQQEEMAVATKQKEQEEKQKQEEEKQQALLAKKEAAKEKRRIAKEKRKAEQELSKEIDQEVSNLVKTPKPKKARVVRGDNPPAWFQKYIEGVKREQSHATSEKKPVKQIQQEAEQEAKSKWENGLVRDRLQNEVDGHMNRMYSMIFGSRNMR